MTPPWNGLQQTGAWLSIIRSVKLSLLSTFSYLMLNKWHVENIYVYNYYAVLPSIQMFSNTYAIFAVT